MGDVCEICGSTVNVHVIVDPGYVDAARGINRPPRDTYICDKDYFAKTGHHFDES